MHMPHYALFICAEGKAGCEFVQKDVRGENLRRKIYTIDKNASQKQEINDIILFFCTIIERALTVFLT